MSSGARTIALTNSMRTSAGSHERFMILEVFGRYAGHTAFRAGIAAEADAVVLVVCGIANFIKGEHKNVIT